MRDALTAERLREPPDMNDNNATLPSSVLPSSTVQHNRELDEQILRQEPPDDLTRAAAWWQRRYFATAYSTIKSWFQ